jgi:hypothetical protein
VKLQTPNENIAYVHVRQSWVETSGISILFKSANVLLEPGDTLGIPVTSFDISDNHFIEITFYPRVIQDWAVNRVRAFIPKQEIVLIVEHKRVEDPSALGYEPDNRRD